MDSLEVIILAVLIVQNVSWYIYLHMRLNGLERNTETGLKNQQEIKTKLTNIKKRQYDIPNEEHGFAWPFGKIPYADGS